MNVTAIHISIGGGRYAGIYRVHYQHKTDGWEGSGNLMDIHTVGSHLVGVHPLNMKPILVAHSLEECIERLEHKYNVKIELPK